MSTDILNKELITTDGIVVINREKKIVAFNKAAVRISGFKENEVKLKNFKILFKDNLQDANLIVKALTNAESFSNLSLNITSSND